MTFEYAPAPESRAIVDIKPSYGLFINGEFVDGTGKAFKTINPATEEVRERIRGHRPIDEVEGIRMKIALAKKGLNPTDEGILRGE